MRPIQAKTVFPKNRRIDSVHQAFAEVILGRPSAKCKHLGICKIEKVYTNSFRQKSTSLCKSSSRIFALASFVKETYFELTFERLSITETVFRNHFESGVFKIEEDYTIDSDFMGTQIRIEQGEYKLNFSDTLLSVRFGL